MFYVKFSLTLTRLALIRQGAANISARDGNTMIVSSVVSCSSDITPEKFAEVKIGNGEIVSGKPDSFPRMANSIMIFITISRRLKLWITIPV